MKEPYLISIVRVTKWLFAQNSVRESVEVMMQKSSLSKYLDLMVSNEDASQGKPSPEMYEKAMNFFELSPKECLVLEDNPNGIEAAKKSGAHLMVINEVSDVNIEAILKRINDIENEGEIVMPSINILILSAASRSPVNHEDTYPTCLMEENGSSLLEKNNNQDI